MVTFRSSKGRNAYSSKHCLQYCAKHQYRGGRRAYCCNECQSASPDLSRCLAILPHIWTHGDPPFMFCQGKQRSLDIEQ